MEKSLLQGLRTFPFELVSTAESTPISRGQSTLIEANISLFHDMPETTEKDVTESADPAEKLSSYDQGVEAGRTETKAIYEQTISLLQNSLTECQREFSLMREQIEQGHLSALSSVLETLLPGIARESARLETESILENICKPAIDGQVLITVHPDDLDAFKIICAPHLEGISLTSDESLEREQIKMQWHHGGAEINPGETTRACLDVFKRAQREVE